MLTACSSALASIDCRGNVTIASLDDAQQVRDGCREIGGDLEIMRNIPGNVDLDGLEVLRGSLFHHGCAYVTRSECYKEPRPKPMNISMPSLREIHGQWDFATPAEVVGLILPKLKTVSGAIFLWSRGVEFIDITELERVASFVLDAPNLETLLLDGIKGPSKGSENGFFVRFQHAGQIKSVDGFFKHPINILHNDEYDSRMILDDSNIPNVKKINFQWARVQELVLGGVNKTLVFGGSQTNSIELDRLLLQASTYLEYDDALEHLIVKDFEMYESDARNLSLRIEEATNISIYSCDRLESITLYPTARTWKNLNLAIENSDSLRLSLKPDGKSQTTWYWPEGDVDTIDIQADIADDFL